MQLQTYEIEVRAGGQSYQLYIQARSLKAALADARRQARYMMSATAFRFASFIPC